MSDITVSDLIREAKRLLLLANRDRHALPADGELSAARYLLDRALVLLEFDAATVPDDPTPDVPGSAQPAWRIDVDP